eukprot:598894-Rhodomonas_salina.1
MQPRLLPSTTLYGVHHLHNHQHSSLTPGHHLSIPIPRMPTLGAARATSRHQLHHAIPPLPRGQSHIHPGRPQRMHSR